MSPTRRSVLASLCTATAGITAISTASATELSGDEDSPVTPDCLTCSGSDNSVSTEFQLGDAIDKYTVNSEIDKDNSVAGSDVTVAGTTSITGKCKPASTDSSDTDEVVVNNLPDYIDSIDLRQEVTSESVGIGSLNPPDLFLQEDDLYYREFDGIALSATYEYENFGAEGTVCEPKIIHADIVTFNLSNGGSRTIKCKVEC